MLVYPGITVVEKKWVLILCICQVALGSVAYVPVLASCQLVIPGVSLSFSLCLWLVPPTSLCVRNPGIPVHSGKHLDNDNDIPLAGYPSTNPHSGGNYS